MEEDIKTLENFIEKNIKSRLRTELNANELQAIEHLIARNKKLEEEREHIRFIRGMLPKEQLIVAMCNDDFCRNFGNDFIPKSKIKEKIKELENLYKINVESYNSHEMFYFIKDYIDKVKLVLQELLEEEN